MQRGIIDDVDLHVVLFDQLRHLLMLVLKKIEGQHRIHADLDRRLTGTVVDPMDLAFDAVGQGRQAEHLARAGAEGAVVAQETHQRRTDTLAAHLDQTQVAHGEYFGTGPVQFEDVLELGQNTTLVVFVLHVDEVDDDDAADVAQS